jgi:hypothetical protein
MPCLRTIACSSADKEDYELIVAMMKAEHEHERS